MVAGTGLEPVRIAPFDFKSNAAILQFPGQSLCFYFLSVLHTHIHQ